MIYRGVLFAQKACRSVFQRSTKRAFRVIRVRTVRTTTRCTISRLLPFNLKVIQDFVKYYRNLFIFCKKNVQNYTGILNKITLFYLETQVFVY